jgi:hypothetical protein
VPIPEVIASYVKDVLALFPEPSSS